MNFGISYIVAGGFGRAECRFTPQPSGQLVISINWFHNSSVQLPGGLSSRVIVSTNIANGKSILELDEVQRSDAGIYSCQVKFSNPQDTVTNSTTLRVASESFSNVLYIT